MYLSTIIAWSGAHAGFTKPTAAHVRQRYRIVCGSPTEFRRNECMAWSLIVLLEDVMSAFEIYDKDGNSKCVPYGDRSLIPFKDQALQDAGGASKALSGLLESLTWIVITLRSLCGVWHSTVMSQFCCACRCQAQLKICWLALPSSW